MDLQYYSTIINSKNFSTITKATFSLLFHYSSESEKKFSWKRVKNEGCHCKTLGRVMGVENGASVDEATL